MIETEKSRRHRRGHANKNKQAQGRRDALKFIGYGTGAVVLGGILYALSRSNGEENTLTPEQKDSVSNLLTYYPEASGYQARQIIEFSNNSGISTSIVNFSSAEVDKESAINFFDALDSFVSRHSFEPRRVQLSDGNLEFAIKPQNARRVLFIVSDDMPFPAQSTNDIATTKWGQSEILSFIRVGMNQHIDLIAGELDNNAVFLHNTLFAVEACQSTVYTGVSTLDDEDQLLMQEVLCNSIGRAIALRQNGTAYKDYYDLVSDTELMASNVGGGNTAYFLLPLSEEDYLFFPTKSVFK